MTKGALLLATRFDAVVLASMTDFCLVIHEHGRVLTESNFAMYNYHAEFGTCFQASRRGSLAESHNSVQRQR